MNFSVIDSYELNYLACESCLFGLRKIICCYKLYCFNLLFTLEI